MATTLTKKTDNYLYAPGIATYGIDGKAGETGEKGTAIFYTDYNFTSQSEEDDDLKTMLICIKQQRCLIKAYQNTVLARPYIDGDYVICSSGEIYKMQNLDEIDAYSSSTTYNKYFILVGKIDNTVDDKIYFTPIDDGTNDRIILKSDYSGIDLAQSSFEFRSDLGEYILRIGTSPSSTDGLSKILAFVEQNGITNTTSLNIYYDNNTNAWYISSENPIVIDSPVVEIKDDTDVTRIDNYSQVETTKSSITGFYNAVKLCSWTASDGEIIIKVVSENDNTIKAGYNLIKAGSTFPIVSIYYESGLHNIVQLTEDSFDDDNFIFTCEYDESESPSYVAFIKYIEVFITKE